MEWQLYIERLKHYYGDGAVESFKRRIESEIKCVGRLVSYIKDPPNTFRHPAAHHYKRRVTLIKAIGRCFDIIDEMNRLIHESKQTYGIPR